MGSRARQDGPPPGRSLRFTLRWSKHPRWLGAFVAAGVFLGVLAVGLLRPRPNLLLIVVSGLRADALDDSLGAPHTPNLDRLAREGLVFHEAFAHSPTALPATMAILSAREPHESGVLTAGHAPPRDVTLLAEHLSRRGYRTAASVSRPELRPDGPGSGIERGFASFDPGPREPAAGDATESGATEHAAEGGARRAVAALEGMNPRRPFFLLAQLAGPHRPEGGHGSATPATAQELDHSSPATLEAGTLAATRARYKLEVEAADRAIGELLAVLDRRGIAERTLVVVTSDHGQALGERGHVGHVANLYDELLRVPLVVRLPGGRRSEALESQRRSLVRHADLAPTLLRLMTQPALPGASGRSLLGPGERVLLAQTHPPDAPRRLLALRDDVYKLILDTHSGEHALYRLRYDPQELDNVFSHQGHLRDAWQRELAELAQSFGPDVEAQL